MIKTSTVLLAGASLLAISTAQAGLFVSAAAAAGAPADFIIAGAKVYTGAELGPDGQSRTRRPASDASGRANICS